MTNSASLAVDRGFEQSKGEGPPDLSLRLRVAISRESKQARRRRFEGAMVRLSNALNAFMVPATAGLVSAVLTFRPLLGFFALPQQLQASSSDVASDAVHRTATIQSAFGIFHGEHGR